MRSGSDALCGFSFFISPKVRRVYGFSKEVWTPFSRCATSLSEDLSGILSVSPRTVIFPSPKFETKRYATASS